MRIFKKKTGWTNRYGHPIINKKFFNMMKNTKSNPIPQQNRVKKVFSIAYQLVTNVTLTAMPY